MTHSSDELNRLISAALDGQLSEVEQEQLRDQLRNSPEAQQRYLELAHLDSLLQWEQGEELLLSQPAFPSEVSTPPSNSSRYRRQVQRLRWMLATTLLLCCLLTGLLFFQLGQPEAVARGRDPLSESVPVAIISQAENVVWGSTDLLDSLKEKVGKPLTTGWIKLESGRVQLDFYGGTTIVLEGPTELGITARNRAHLKSGKVTFFSGDQPGGFYLVSDQAQLFGERANGGVIVTGHQLEVHALKGELKLFDAHIVLDIPEPVLIEEGTALVLPKGAKNVKPVSFDRNRFVHEHELELDEQPGTSVPFHFTSQPMLAYGFQDGQHDLPAEGELVDDGERLVLRGNTWKMFKINQEMTDDLVIEFEFRSESEGQIHGLGFDTDDTYNDRSSVIQIHGYEALPTIGQQYNTYREEEWQTFRIPVGRYFSGAQKYLYFVADDDVTARAESEFRNVRFFRRVSKPVQ
ncbi:MAG: hypothetical protein KDA65_07320 [Planctomycetaceae bacterium]|nr:hypothetical protein [Planctomycetaceae bacterium]